MSNRKEALTAWCAAAVDAAIGKSGLTKVEVSELTGIPYSTLNRKLAGKADFQFRELLELADATNTHPAAFTPPPFNARRGAAA